MAVQYVLSGSDNRVLYFVDRFHCPCEDSVDVGGIWSVAKHRGGVTYFVD